MEPSIPGACALSPAEVELPYPVRVARIARGELACGDKSRIVECATHLDAQWRGGFFNGLEYFHFRCPGRGATMAAFIAREGLHRLVPGSNSAPSASEVEAEWRRIAHQREVVLAWARANKALMEIVQAYRFERRQCAGSASAHAVAAGLVEQIDRSLTDPMTYAGVCIEWAAREYRQWFWRCAPDHQVL